jgi:plastocyanin
MRSPKTLHILAFCLILGSFCLAAHASGQSTLVTAQARVKVAGAASNSARHSNEGVVLWLTPVDTEIAPSRPPGATKSRPQLAQKNKQFVPHILVVEVGSIVAFPNLDPFFHNVFSRFDGKKFDLGLYESGSSRDVHFDRPGVSYIFCNIHPEMSAVVVSVPTPYFAVSSAAGNLVIHDVVPGAYIMHVWAMGDSDTNLAAIGRRVFVSGSGLDLGTIALEESVSSAHKNKFGEDYEEKRPWSY